MVLVRLRVLVTQRCYYNGKEDLPGIHYEGGPS